MFTEQDLINKVVELAEKNTNFVYSPGRGNFRCKYVPDEKQSGCIFGQALLELGFSKEELLVHDFSEWAVGISEILHPLGFSTKIQNWARYIQVDQDGGEKWGDCLIMNPPPTLINRQTE